MIGIGMPINQSKRPLAIIFSCLFASQSNEMSERKFRGSRVGLSPGRLRSQRAPHCEDHTTARGESPASAGLGGSKETLREAICCRCFADPGQQLAGSA